MKKFVSMLLVLAVMFGVWWLYGKVSVVETRITAVAGEYEDSFNTKGIILRNEYPITCELEGTLQSSVPSGSRVSRYTDVAYVYSGSADDSVVQELSRVNARIEEINNIQDTTLLSLTDVDEINSKISSFSEQIAKLSYSGSFTEISGLEDEINILIGRKKYLEGESAGENNDLAALLGKKAELETRLGGKRMVLGAPVSGLYFDFTDGYEGLNVNDASSLTADTVNKICKGADVGAKIDHAVCKVTDNSSWVISSVIGKDEAAGLAEGQSVLLRFNETDEKPVNAVVSSFVYDGKKIIVNFEGSAYIGNVYSERTCTVDVIKKTYRGLKIPAKAVYQKGEAGDVVAVRTSGGEVEKTVQVLYSPPDGTVIVKAGSDSGELLLYDEVIVKTNRK